VLPAVPPPGAAPAPRTVFIPPGAPLPAAPDGGAPAAFPAAGASVITSAAVLGRPGEAEPVAAALALALRRESRAKAATVVVVGPSPAEPVEGGASGAARRIATRLEAHGVEARVRGRLAWVRLDAGDPHVHSLAQRVTLIAAPAVLAVTAPRTAALDAALVEQDLLLVVTADPGGPLAGLAASGLTSVPVLPVRPLGRGPARSLARAGVRSARAVRGLVEARR
jgi:hypothetical protein